MPYFRAFVIFLMGLMLVGTSCSDDEDNSDSEGGEILRINALSKERQEIATGSIVYRYSKYTIFEIKDSLYLKY